MTIYEAIHTTIKAHEHQHRKLDNDKYAAHPIEVGILLAKYGFSDEVICAGILHDTVEDTSVTLQMLRDQFGDTIANYVSYCSESDKSLPWKERKLAYLKQIQNAPKEVLYIICTDKLTNIKSIYRNIDQMGSSLWDVFNAGYDQQKWYYQASLDALSSLEGHPLYEELKSYVHLVFHHH